MTSRKVPLFFALTGLGLLAFWLMSCSVTPALPWPAVTPTCYLAPQATGEKIVMPTFISTLPASARPGQTLELRFSGGYVALNNARMCGETLTGYIFSDALSTPAVIRNIGVLLNEQPLTVRVDCADVCRVEVDIPPDTPPGKYTLSLLSSWAERTKMDLDIK